MQPLGYYGLNLGNEVEQAIDGMLLHELTDMTSDISADLNNAHYLENDEVELIPEEKKFYFHYTMTDLKKLALLRGLCDRIEAKLLEAAK